MQFALPMAIRANAVYKAERKVVIPHSKLAQAHHVLYPGVLKMYSKYAPSLPPRETLLRYDDAVSASGRFGTDAFLAISSPLLFFLLRSVPLYD